MIALAVLLLPSFSVRADFPKPRIQETTEPHAAAKLTRLEFDQPRPLRVWAMRIDLGNPDVEIVVTPRGKAPAGFQVVSETTKQFAEAHGLLAAINGGPFSPVRSKSGEPMNLMGLHLSRGELIAPPEPWRPYAAWMITADNRAVIRPYPIAADELNKARHGVGGYEIIVTNGKNRFAGVIRPGDVAHPRTAVGASVDGRTLWWLVVDGRQSGRSEGLYCDELGELAVSFGITELLNLDGGGSTTLVVKDTPSGEHKITNNPVGAGLPGTLRPNGNNIGLRVYSGDGDLTASQLGGVMPKLKANRVQLFLGPLNRAMTRFQINTPLRRAAFLAQLAHESGELRYLEEIADGQAYEGRTDLGNSQPGDGKRFKGRGPIQLTGRNNYRKAGAALEIDLENEPTRAADPEIGCLIAGWFWQTHGLNELADRQEFTTITRRINGGENGRDNRERLYERAKNVFGKNSEK